MESVTLEVGTGTYRLKAFLFLVGADLQVVIYGGDQPHVGAVAVARVDADGSVSVDLIGIGSHREGIVVEPAAVRLATALGTTVVVCAGMHWEQIDAAGIAIVLDNARLLVEDVLQYMLLKSDC